MASPRPLVEIGESPGRGARAASRRAASPSGPGTGGPVDRQSSSMLVIIRRRPQHVHAPAGERWRWSHGRTRAASGSKPLENGRRLARNVSCARSSASGGSEQSPAEAMDGAVEKRSTSSSKAAASPRASATSQVRRICSPVVRTPSPGLPQHSLRRPAKRVRATARRDYFRQRVSGRYGLGRPRGGPLLFLERLREGQELLVGLVQIDVPRRNGCRTLVRASL